MKQSRLHSQSGFGLVEIMVGLVIGLVTMLVITQVGALFEEQKRTSTGGADAQVNGGIALFNMEREIRMAGYGLFATPGKMMCPLGINMYYDLGGGSSTVTNAGQTAPVAIIDGGVNPDTILTLRSDTGLAMPVEFDKGYPPDSSVFNVKKVDEVYLPKDGDLFVVGSPDGTKVCTLVQMSQPPKAVSSCGGPCWNLVHNAGVSTPYNPPNPTGTFTVAPLYGAPDVIMNMGSFISRRYDVISEHLTETDPSKVPPPYDSTKFGTGVTPLVAQIVYMKAQYGVAPPASQIINEWKNPTGDWAWNPAGGTPSAANIARIKAIRIAIVARSPQLEKLPVTTSPLTLFAGVAAPDALPTYAPVGVDALRYRYKVFETVVPIRNVIWAGT